MSDQARFRTVRERDCSEIAEMIFDLLFFLFFFLSSVFAAAESSPVDVAMKYDSEQSSRVLMLRPSLKFTVLKKNPSPESARKAPPP